MVFREGRTKAVGNTTKLFPHVSAVAQNIRQQRAQKKAQENKHQTNPQNEPQKASKRTKRSRHHPHDQQEEAQDTGGPTETVTWKQKAAPGLVNSTVLFYCNSQPEEYFIWTINSNVYKNF